MHVIIVSNHLQKLIFCNFHNNEERQKIILWMIDSHCIIVMLKTKNHFIGFDCYMLNTSDVSLIFFQEKTEKKLQQIKSSVRLPIYSFSENPIVSIKPIISNEIPSSPELQQQHNTDTDKCSTLDDILPLKSDGSENDSLDEQKQPSPPHLETLDLSTTCHGIPELSLSTQGKTNNVLFEPFDYEAARKQINLEEEHASENKNNDDINGKILKGGSKKNKQKGIIGKGYQEETSDFEMPKRRPAFPASGNRSATFRD